MDETRATSTAHERLTLAEAGERYLVHLSGVMERKATTVQDYTIMLNRHLAPFFAGRGLDRIDGDLVAAYRQTKLSEGLAHKTVQNHLAFLHGIFNHALKRGWVRANPVARSTARRRAARTPTFGSSTTPNSKLSSAPFQMTR